MKKYQKGSNVNLAPVWPGFAGINYQAIQQGTPLPTSNGLANNNVSSKLVTELGQPNYGYIAGSQTAQAIMAYLRNKKLDKDFNSYNQSQSNPLLQIPFSPNTSSQSLYGTPLMKSGGPTASKAAEMLKDGTANGKKLTAKQKKYFQCIAHGGCKKQYGGSIDDEIENDIFNEGSKKIEQQEVEQPVVKKQEEEVPIFYTPSSSRIALESEDWSLLGLEDLVRDYLQRNKFQTGGSVGPVYKGPANFKRLNSEELQKPQTIERAVTADPKPVATKQQYLQSQKEAQEFYKYYLQSPKYQERLNNFSYKYFPEGIVVKDRLSRIKGKEQFLDLGQGSGVRMDNFNIEYDPKTDAHFGFTPDYVTAHELSHRIGSMKGYGSYTNGWNALTNEESKAIDSRNKAYPGLWPEHDARNWEMKADFDALRFRLHKLGIYDAGKEDFTPDHLKKIKDDSIFKDDDSSLNRLFKYFDDDSIIWIMNNIAKNNSSDNPNAKKGGIYIKKENRGKFTDYCGGKVTAECINRGKHSSNPTTRKRATFAANARKWHQEGGMVAYNPNHPTFSVESIYSIPENPGGYWKGDKYIPQYQEGGKIPGGGTIKNRRPKSSNLKDHSTDKLGDGLTVAERNKQLADQYYERKEIEEAEKADQEIKYVNYLKSRNLIPDLGKISIKDNRKVVKATGQPINPNRDLKSGQFDRRYIEEISQAARRVGVDSGTALAIALQESMIGQRGMGAANFGHSGTVNSGTWEDVEQHQQDVGYTDDSQMGASKLAYTLKDKLNYAKKLGIKDEATQIQTYNGLGKIRYKGKYYGQNVEGLNLRDNPLYGNTIIDIRDNILKKNLDVNNILNGYYKDQVPSAPIEFTPFKDITKMSNGGSEYKEGGYYYLDEKEIDNLKRQGYEIE